MTIKEFNDDLRSRMNISKSQFANALYVSQNYIWQIENGKRKIPNNYINKLYETFELTHNDTINLILIVAQETGEINIKSDNMFYDVIISLLENALD